MVGSLDILVQVSGASLVPRRWWKVLGLAAVALGPEVYYGGL